MISSSRYLLFNLHVKFATASSIDLRSNYCKYGFSVLGWVTIVVISFVYFSKFWFDLIARISWANYMHVVSVCAKVLPRREWTLHFLRDRVTCRRSCGRDIVVDVLLVRSLHFRYTTEERRILQLILVILLFCYYCVRSKNCWIQINILQSCLFTLSFSLIYK